MYKYNNTYRKMQLENDDFHVFFFLANESLKLHLSIRFFYIISIEYRLDYSVKLKRASG